MAIRNNAHLQQLDLRVSSGLEFTVTSCIGWNQVLQIFPETIKVSWEYLGSHLHSGQNLQPSATASMLSSALKGNGLKGS